MRPAPDTPLLGIAHEPRGGSDVRLGVRGRQVPDSGCLGGELPGPTQELEEPGRTRAAIARGGITPRLTLHHPDRLIDDVGGEVAGHEIAPFLGPFDRSRRRHGPSRVNVLGRGRRLHETVTGVFEYRLLCGCLTTLVGCRSGEQRLGFDVREGNAQRRGRRHQPDAQIDKSNRLDFRQQGGIPSGLGLQDPVLETRLDGRIVGRSFGRITTSGHSQRRASCEGNDEHGNENSNEESHEESPRTAAERATIRRSLEYA